MRKPKRPNMGRVKSIIKYNQWQASIQRNARLNGWKRRSNRLKVNLRLFVYALHYSRASSRAFALLNYKRSKTGKLIFK